MESKIMFCKKNIKKQKTRSSHYHQKSTEISLQSSQFGNLFSGFVISRKNCFFFKNHIEILMIFNYISLNKQQKRQKSFRAINQKPMKLQKSRTLCKKNPLTNTVQQLLEMHNVMNRGAPDRESCYPTGYRIDQIEKNHLAGCRIGEKSTFFKCIIKYIIY